MRNTWRRNCVFLRLCVVLALGLVIFSVEANAQQPITSCTNITQSGYYRLDQNISGLLSGQDYCIGIFANDVTLDGQGFSIAGKGSGTGIYVQASNVKITNSNVSNYWRGIYLYRSNNNMISNSTIHNNDMGIGLSYSNSNIVTNCTNSKNYIGISVFYSNNNMITYSMIQNNYRGIGFSYSNNNTVSDSAVYTNGYGIGLSFSNNNVIANCVISKNFEKGIELESSDSNVILNCKISENLYGGVGLSYSNNNTIINCKISDNYGDGIHLGISSNNKITNNEFTNCGLFVYNSYQNTVSENTVNGKPLVYMEDTTSGLITEAGQVILVNSSNVVIRDLQIYNATAGIELWKSYNVLVENCKIFDNYRDGVYLGYSNNNRITNSTIYNNGRGINLWYSNDNLIYNNLFNNRNNVYVYLYYSSNKWNVEVQLGKNILGGNLIAGNAWLSPDGTGFSQTCSDDNADGICDQPYNIDSRNIDSLPLKYPQPILTPIPTTTSTPTPTPSYMADLNVTAISVDPEQPTTGQTATINATISNIGNGNAGTFNVSFFATDKTQLGFILLRKVTIQSLNAGGSVFAEIQWTPSEAGKYAIRVIADHENAVMESNEDNNMNSKIVSVVAIPTTPKPPVGGEASVYVTVSELVKSNRETRIELPQSAFFETNVLALTILSSEDNIVRFRIEKLRELPTDIPEPKGDLLLLMLKIEPTLSKESSLKGKIQFGILIDEIEARGFNPNAVALVLLKWNGREWVELPTKFLSSDGKYNYCEATTDSFSYFVAQLKPLETQTATPTPKPTPGFEAIFAIAGLAAIAYLLRRES